MLIRFRVQNFRSIKVEQELSLVASPLTDNSSAVVHASGLDVGILRAAAIYGPNGSGKSTVCHALRFMQDAVVDSHRSWKPDGGVPREPFALDTVSSGSATSFVVDLLLDGVRYEYGFAVDSTRVVEEWLFAFPKGRRQEWFTRDADRADEFSFSRLLSGENRTIAALTRPNSLFLSAAAQNNHEMLAPVYGWFSERLMVVEAVSFPGLLIAISRRCEDPEFRSRLFSILEAADLGLAGIEIEKDPEVSAVRGIQGLLAAFAAADLRGVRLLHRTSGGSEVPLPFINESAGTKILFGLAGAIINSMDSGGTLVVDELDRSLHPHLALKIVQLFNDATTNHNDAQLVFNTHDTNLLDLEILRRDQIWFTEKDNEGATHLFPLTDFHARKLENVERGYLQGRYGAVPVVDTPEFLRPVAT